MSEWKATKTIINRSRHEINELPKNNQQVIDYTVFSHQHKKVGGERKKILEEASSSYN